MTIAAIAIGLVVLLVVGGWLDYYRHVGRRSDKRFGADLMCGDRSVADHLEELEGKAR